MKINKLLIGFYILEIVSGLILPMPSLATTKVFQVNTLSGGSLTTGLVSYYKYEDATDYYGSNNLNSGGTPTYTAGKISNALTLNGSSQYLVAASATPFNFTKTDAFSFAGWVKRGAINSSQVIIDRGDVTNNHAQYLFYFPSGNQLATYIYDSAGNYIRNISTETYTSTSAFYHVVVTYDGSNTAAGIHMYVNGTSVTNNASNSGTVGTQTTSIATSFGVDVTSNFGFYTGQHDEFGIWSKVLSANEISDLYNGGSGQTMVVQTVSNRKIRGVGISR